MNKNLIITISREYGSGGNQIGKKLADALSIPFYDKEILELSAKESGFNPETIKENEESLSGSFSFGIAMGNYYIDNPIPLQVYQAECHVIKELAAKGACVIVGRCAGYILGDDFDCLEVFIGADMEDRCKRATEEYGEDPKHVKKTVANIDKHRAKHIKHYTDKSWLDASNYHICLDSTSLGIDGCVEVLKAAVNNFKS